MTTTTTVNNDSNKNKHVGILALEVYTPRTYIDQSELEEHLGVPAGKYTVGLGQQGLGGGVGRCRRYQLALSHCRALLVGKVSDNACCMYVCMYVCVGVVVCVCVAHTHSLFHTLTHRYDINPSQIGRLEVGTETLVDKSKSTKTVLMDLFPDNPDMEGATVVNACYGGTAALFHTLDWCESDYNNNNNNNNCISNNNNARYGLVVAADIAAYAAGPARPTCGAGAVAILVGRDAPLAWTGQRTTHAQHVWDFFKPNPTVEYPTVDGALSQVCYYQALEDVYQRYCQKSSSAAGGSGCCVVVDATSPDTYMVFHAPYNKLVQKSYARLFLLDARRRHANKNNKMPPPAGGGDEDQNDDEEAEEKKETHEASDDEPANNNNNNTKYDELQDDDELLGEWLTKPIEDTYYDKTLEKVLKSLSAVQYQQKLADSNAASILVGNTYTASVFLGLASLVDRVGATQLLGKNIVMFSYGSGAMASMYGLLP